MASDTRTAPSTVLVVDGEAAAGDYLASVLRKEGHECISFSKSLEALSYMSRCSRPVDLVLADLGMPGMNGIELLRSVKSVDPGLPVIMVSSLYGLALTIEALKSGADDYLKKPIHPGDLISIVAKYLRRDLRGKEHAILESLREFLMSPDGVSNNPQQVQKMFQELGWKRYETLQHSKRVAGYTRLLAQRRGLPLRDLTRLEVGALLHDIGKIAVPRNVLLKPGPLNREEWRVMKIHPSIGFQLLAEFPDMQQEAEVVYGHHEAYNGSGYPRGLSGEEIPFGARLFSIVDAFDAMTSDRPYRRAHSMAKAREEIAHGSGKQFDPELVALFLSIPTAELAAVRARTPDPPAGFETGTGL